jgi:hypothetical protein
VCFGDALRTAVTKCTHHFHNRKTIHEEGMGKVEQYEQQWVWIGARWREIGFDGSIIQLFAATIFWISTVTGIPGVIDMDNIGLVDGIYWVPQVVGGSGFIIARY